MGPLHIRSGRWFAAFVVALLIVAPSGAAWAVRAGVSGIGIVAVVAIASGAMALTSDDPGESPDAPIVEAVTEAKLCANDEIPQLSVESDPDETTPGAATVLEAIKTVDSRVAIASDFVQTPLGSIDEGAPIWIEAKGSTYLAVQAPAGGWHVSPATFEGCDDLSEFKTLD